MMNKLKVISLQLTLLVGIFAVLTAAGGSDTDVLSIARCLIQSIIGCASALWSAIKLGAFSEVKESETKYSSIGYRYTKDGHKQEDCNVNRSRYDKLA